MTFDEIKSKLSTKQVGIAGAGGLGSNCAVALARVGVGNIVIADFDVVTLSNLNRQYYFFNQIGFKKVLAIKENIQLINPMINVFAYDRKLSPKDIIEIYKNCNVIVEAFDKAEMKQMIIETVLTEIPHIPLVVGVGMAGFGKNNLITTKKFDNLYVCGDGKNEVSDELPPLAPRVGIVSHMQANQVLEILLNS